MSHPEKNNRCLCLMCGSKDNLRHNRGGVIIE